MGSIAAAQSAIQALYGSDSGQRQAANVWLTKYASSEQGWECLQLLQRDLAPEVQFFSVNLILSKVRHAWRQLQPEARQQVQTFVRYPPHRARQSDLPAFYPVNDASTCFQDQIG